MKKPFHQKAGTRGVRVMNSAASRGAGGIRRKRDLAAWRLPGAGGHLLGGRGSPPSRPPLPRDVSQLRH